MDENSPAFRAAAAILQDREVTAHDREPLSIRAAAVQFNTGVSAINRALASLTTRGHVPSTISWRGPLTEAEDLLLLEYVECVQRSGFPITKSQLMAAARDLRRRRDPTAGEIDRDFYGSWLLDHPEVRIYRDATTLSMSGEVNLVSIVIKFFDDLTKIVRDCRVGASEYWSQDECSIRAGTVRQQVQVAVMESIRSQTSRGVDPSNPESTGLLVTANGAGDTIPPWLIFKTFPASWPEEGEAVDDNDESIRFVQSATGFSNAEIALQWLRHFNMWSWKRSERAQQSGKTLEEWFGCDAWLRNPQTPHSEPHTATPTVRLPHEKIYRLLVIDSSLGHTSLDFFDYCRKFDIIVIVIPSDLPYILHPLDVGVFQPLNLAHEKLQKSLAGGTLACSRQDFLRAFEKMYDQGFSKDNVLSGFDKTGIYPPKSSAAIVKVFDTELRQGQP